MQRALWSCFSTDPCIRAWPFSTVPVLRILCCSFPVTCTRLLYGCTAALLKHATCLAVRQDNDVPLERLLPPWRHRSVAEVRGQARQALMPLEVQGDRQYYISVPHGHILNKEVRGCDGV